MSTQNPEKVGRILIIDDDPSFAAEWTLRFGSSFEVETAESAEIGIQTLSLRRPDLILLDLQLPGMDGLKALLLITEDEPHPPVIMVSSHESPSLVVQALESGAADYWGKSEDPDLLTMKTQRTLEHYRNNLYSRYLSQSLSRSRGERSDLILGSSPSSLQLERDIARVADAGATVLITGETGTGKELVANAIHSNSARAHRPMIPENAGAWNKELVDDILFGHVKGAFTGAISSVPGIFEAASGGTVFIDEISELSIAHQVKLLRVIQEKRARRAGTTNAEIPCDFRLISASNKDLARLVSEAEFREDLYYRLNVLEVKVPPLRERRDDIPLLCEFFIAKHAAENNPKVLGINRNALLTLQSRSWPGNIRQLENEIIAALTRCDGDILRESDFGNTEAVQKMAPSGLECFFAPEGGHSVLPYHRAKNELLSQFQKKYLRHCLKLAGGTVAKASRFAKLGPQAFHNMMRRAGITRVGE